MAVTLKQVEAIPESYPLAGNETAWQRIEAYTAHRWTARQVIWTVEGPGEWSAPLTPATVTETEIWQDDAWTSVTLRAGPMGGYVLDGEGPYRITATVGGGTPPAAVREAHSRLTAYLDALAADDLPVGISQYSVGLGGEIREHFERDPNTVAKAMQASGAADLLRPYRRA
ncbi:MAG: hypothetical protein CMJ42_11635 [Phyllobacteriaceae bacterium]|nr:hypothetical protein [Phyllobacteriaceae bacterium]MBA90641.1 hypothetical protein [Phyllobacteriaceae bacterium]